MAVGVYHKIQVVSCASAKLHLIMGLVDRLRNILDVDEIQGSRTSLASSTSGKKMYR